VEWEKPISFEWLNKDGSAKFQVDCGARIQGGFFRQASASEKHSFRLLFKSDYGVGRLRADIVDQPGAADSFDTIVFRAGGTDGYAWGGAGTTVQFLRDEFGRRIAAEAGHASPRGGFQHLYINGLYWGLYNLTERPNENFSATYYGGEDEDWDSINSGEVKQAGGKENGNDPSNSGLRDWNAYVSDAKSAETYADWMALQGLNPDGTRNPDMKVYLDADHYADYMIINFWGGNWDWPNKNFWFGRLNTDESTGFKHYTWDFENTMGNNRDRSPLNMKAPRNTQWVGEPYAALNDLLWFHIKWADRTHRLFHNGGLLSSEKTIARYSAMADEIEPAMYAETARWGDDNQFRAHTIEEWRDERDWMLETYLPQRTEIVLGQFEDEDLYSSKGAPVLTQHGGSVSTGYELSFEGATANLFYTKDGSDPYAFVSDTIEVSDSAVAYENPIPVTGTTTVKARYYSKSIFGGVTWSALTEATFTLGTDDLQISELMYHPTAPTDAERASGWTSASQFEYLVIMNTGASVADLNGVVFDAGVDFDFSDSSIKTMGAGENVILVRNLAAFESRYGKGHPVAGEYGGKLDDSGETLRLLDGNGSVIHAFRYEDSEPWPVNADGGGATLVLSDPPSKPDSSEAESWSEGTALQGEGGGGPDGDSAFTTWLGANGLAQANGDDDGDGIANIFEYVFGSDPKKGDSDVGPVFTRVSEGAASVPALVYSESTASGVTVTVEGSQDLTTWTPVGSPEWETQEDAGTISVLLRQQNAGSPRFLRLAVSQD
jgi:hypothetical protein